METRLPLCHCTEGYGAGCLAMPETGWIDAWESTNRMNVCNIVQNNRSLVNLNIVLTNLLRKYATSTIDVAYLKCSEIGHLLALSLGPFLNFDVVCKN